MWYTIYQDTEPKRDLQEPAAAEPDSEEVHKLAFQWW